MTVDQVIGAHVGKLRSDDHLTQRQLAYYLTATTDTKWDQQLVSHAEHGRRPFRVTDLIALAAIFEVSVLALTIPPPEITWLKSGPVELAASGFAFAWVAYPREHRGDKTAYAETMPPKQDNVDQRISGLLEAIGHEPRKETP